MKQVGQYFVGMTVKTPIGDHTVVDLSDRFIYVRSKQISQSLKCLNCLMYDCKCDEGRLMAFSYWSVK